MFFEEPDVVTGTHKSIEMKTDSLSQEELPGKVKSACKVEDKSKEGDGEEDIQSEM